MKQNFWNDKTGRFELMEVRDAFPPEPVSPIWYVVLVLLVLAVAFAALAVLNAPPVVALP